MKHKIIKILSFFSIIISLSSCNISNITENTSFTSDITKQKFTVTWLNSDGSVLEIDENVEYGSIPEYNGDILKKPRSDYYSFTFSGWKPELKQVTSDINYFAQYNFHYVIEDLLEFTLNDDKESYTITGINIWSSYDHYIEIPEEYNNLPITKIGDFAFSEVGGIVSINIPSSVQEIGKFAFSECKDLTEVTFSQNSKLEIINIYAFESCNKLVSIDIPESVVNIEEKAFYKCKNLKTINFSEDSQLNVISDSVFYNCENLESIYIPKNVSLIESFAFGSCELLKEVEFSEKTILSTIESHAFSYCTSLEEIIINTNVKNIYEDAFYACDALTIYCKSKKSDTNFGENWYGNSPVVWGYIGIKGITNDGLEYGVGEDESNIKYITITKYIKNDKKISIPSKININNENIPVKIISNNVFSNATNLESLFIPSSIISIGDYAFACIPDLSSGCYNLKTIEFEVNSKLKYIGKCAFKSSPISTIEIPDAVEVIDECAFQWCNNLKKVIINENSKLTTLNECAFEGCVSLSSIYIPINVVNIDTDVFFECDLLKIYCASENELKGWKNGWNGDCDVIYGMTYDEYLNNTN